jgi:hypothetical protein
MKKKRPFSNGSEFMYWQEHNCCQCKRYTNPMSSEKKDCCPHEYELAIGLVGDGEIPIRNYNIIFGKRQPQSCKSFKEVKP